MLCGSSCTVEQLAALLRNRIAGQHVEDGQRGHARADAERDRQHHQCGERRDCAGSCAMRGRSSRRTWGRPLTAFRRARRRRRGSGSVRRDRSVAMPSTMCTLRCARAASSGSCVTITMVVPCGVDFLEQLHHAARHLRIEVAGRFVGEQQARRAGERARDRGALLLAAGEFGRVVLHARAQADAAQRVFDARLAFGSAACRDSAAARRRCRTGSGRESG